MTDETNPPDTVILQDSASPKLTFLIDPTTLLFQTYKSEDVGILQNRISLLEIHELLMHINLELLPVVKFLRKTSTLCRISIVLTFLLTIIAIFLKSSAIVITVIISFATILVWSLGVLVLRKKAYSRIINKILKNKKDSYLAKGLKWQLKNFYFSNTQGFPCWLELYLENATSNNQVLNTEENVLVTNETHNFQRAHEDGPFEKLKTAWNLTLGPGVAKNNSFHNLPNHVAFDMCSGNHAGPRIGSQEHVA